MKQARVTHKEGKAVGEEEVEAEELVRREVRKDPWEPRLKPITRDNKTVGGLPPWIIRSFNADAEYYDPKTIDKK